MRPADQVAERSELLLSGPAFALSGLLGVPMPDLEHGQGLPLLWHWVYLLDRPAQADLGPDGHPVRAPGPAPPEPGRRRMWAGGRVRATGPLICGETATRRSSVLSVEQKQGRSGPLTFVVVRHEVLQHGRVVIDEQQDIVYRDPPPSPAAAVPVVEGPVVECPVVEGPVVPAGADEWAIDVTPTLLFRFSALTYNAHRIHYDRDYAREAEGYPGLLTHGPLQALAMAEAARALEHRAQPREYRAQSLQYRLTSPLFDHQGMVVRAVRDQDVTTTAVRDLRGRQTASATLRGLPSSPA